jgi:hypothetical protein
MPDAIGLLSDSKDDGVICWIEGEGNGRVSVSGKPWLTLVQASAQVSGVIVQHDVFIFAIYAAGEASPRDFHFGGFVARHPGVGDCDAPETCGCEACRGGHRIYVSGFVAHFIGYAGIASDHERTRAADSPLLGDNDDAGGRDLVGHDHDEIFWRDRAEGSRCSGEEDCGDCVQIFAVDSNVCAFGTASGKKGVNLGREGLGRG